MIGASVASPYASSGYFALKLEPHLHTVHSDGQDTIQAMFAACQEAGYDVVALTDHNTLSGADEASAVAAELGLIFLHGVEVTTFRGHAVVLGVAGVPEWRDLELRGMDALAAEVHTQGGVLSVAHPASLGSPVCSGCSWEWPVEPGSVDLWEVASAARVGTELPIELWRQMLQRGGRIAPVAAGDVHSARAAASPRTATYVFAKERTSDAVLEALRARRVSTSRGPVQELWLEGPHGEIALAGERVNGDGWTPRTRPFDTRVHTLAVDNAERCVYAERRDDQGQLEAITAPIWISTSH
jgi:PHP domain